jgi:polyisoprenoid-binding protein YceI/cytochrome c551/c552
MKKLLKISMLAMGLMGSAGSYAQGACTAVYEAVNHWGSGAQVKVSVTNNGAALTAWELCWNFNGSETIANLWDGTYSASGKRVCVKNAGYNGNLGSGGSATFGFIVNNPAAQAPTAFTLNGVACGGSPTSSVGASSSLKSSSSIGLSSSLGSSVKSSSLASSSAPNLAASWILDSAKSNLHFVSVKNTDVAENFSFTQLQATVDASGKAVVTIPLASIATNIGIRNERMQSMLFESNYLPSAHFSAQLNMAALNAMAVGAVQLMPVTGDLTLHGVVKAMSFEVLVVKSDANSLSVSPRMPLVINAVDFDMNAGIDLLRTTAGASSIGERVPLYFTLQLSKNNPANLPPIVLAAAPNAPLGLMGNVNQGSGDATLTWTDASNNETGFLVRRKGADARWQTLAAPAANSVSYINSLAAQMGSYEFKVISFQGSTPSAPSNIIALSYLVNSSSSSVISSSVRSSSSVAAWVGDAARGKAAWENAEVGCLFCHAVNANGTAGSSNSLIDPKNLRYTSVSGLTKYIEDNMPRGNVTACVGQCAADTGAYFLSLQPVVASSSKSSTPPSSVSSSSSVGSSSSQANLDGAAIFVEKGCANCHGARGDNPNRPIDVNRWTRASLITKIDASMPAGNPSACVGNCATAIADYILTWRPVVSCDAGEDVLARRLRLLTNREYGNTLNDLLGITTGASVAASLGLDATVKGFDNNVEATQITNVRMDAYWNVAQQLSASVSLTSLLSCNTATARDQCASTFVPAFGKKAFRRPLVAAETTSYSNLFKLGASNEAGARLVIQAMLASPNFLYRSELGSLVNNTYKLSAYETATLLAYTFTGSMPDSTLFTEADNNRLTSAAQLRTQAERLLAGAKAGEQLAHFGMQWLKVGDVANLQRDKTLYPQFTSAIGAAMKTELDLFLKEIFLKPGYKMADVFNPGFSFLNGTLASYYGMNGVTGTQFQKVATNAQRGGVLAMGAVTATLSSVKESHPIHRGLLIRRNLLCQDFAPPPPNIGEVEPLDPNKPTRERFAAHTNNPNCQSCHQYIDNIGFGFENYNAVGQFRTVEGNNLPVDASGGISGLAIMTESDSYSFSDLRGLSTVLATSGNQATSMCLARQYQRFANGVSEPNECAVAASYSRWQSKSTDLRDMMLETVTSPNFLTRK